MADLILHCGEKVFKKPSYSLKFGAVEDVLQIVDVDTLINIFTGDMTSEELNTLTYATVAKSVVNALDFVKSIMKDIFIDLTDDDIRNAPLEDIVKVIVDVIQSSIITIKTCLLLRGNTSKK